MPKTLTPLHRITLPFLMMGFNTKRAFVNVVNSIDMSIPDWDLEFAWDYGICSMGMESKIEQVVETLKSE